MIDEKFRIAIRMDITTKPLNPDQQINHGCNLKWKPTDQTDYCLATTALMRRKIGGKPSLVCK
jgi:hypothetical protein